MDEGNLVVNNNAAEDKQALNEYVYDVISLPSVYMHRHVTQQIVIQTNTVEVGQSIANSCAYAEGGVIVMKIMSMKKGKENGDKK